MSICEKFHDAIKTYADINDHKNNTGFIPQAELEEGLGKFVDWYKDYHNIT